MTHAPAGADPAVVGPYLATALADDRWSSCAVELIAGGKSNLTYRVDSAAGSAVLRRPPLGHVLPTAHDLANVLNIQFYGWLGNLLVASIGAVLVLWIWRSIKGPAT